MAITAPYKRSLEHDSTQASKLNATNDSRHVAKKQKGIVNFEMPEWLKDSLKFPPEPVPTPEKKLSSSFSSPNQDIQKPLSKSSSKCKPPNDFSVFTTEKQEISRLLKTIRGANSNDPIFLQLFKQELSLLRGRIAYKEGSHYQRRELIQSTATAIKTRISTEGFQPPESKKASETGHDNGGFGISSNRQFVNYETTVLEGIRLDVILQASNRRAVVMRERFLFLLRYGREEVVDSAVRCDSSGSVQALNSAGSIFDAGSGYGRGATVKTEIDE